MQAHAKNLVKLQLKLLNPIDSSINATVYKSNIINQNKVRRDNYISYKDTSQSIEQSEDVDVSIDTRGVHFTFPKKK